MTAHRLLFLDSHRLTAYTWQQGSLTLDCVFENDQTGWSQFNEYLRASGNTRYSLLANLAEEGHVLETIPFLRGKDRKALIERKIGQHFLGTQLATSISLGYEKTQRKNEKLLISALTNPGQFEPWLQRLINAEALLAGLYTVAQLGGLLLGKLDFSVPKAQLLTLQDQSIRESYLVNGRVQFSRMVPLNDSSIAGIASGLSTEAGKLHQYLIGQRLIGRNEQIPVFIIAHPQALAAIEAACPDRPQLNFQFINTEHAARQLKLRTPPTDSRSELLFLQLLAIAAPREQFATAEHRHDFRLSQIRQGLLGLGMVALLGSMLFSAKEIFQAHELRGEAAQMIASEADLNWRYQEISATFPQLGIDNETLRRITNRYREIKQQQRLPTAAFSRLSQALSTYPMIQLEEIDWRIVPAALPGSAAPSATEEVTTIRATLNLPKSAPPRQILATFEQFIKTLRDIPNSRVAVLQQPLQLESGNALRGGDFETEGAPPKQFAVEISQKLVP